MQSPEVEQVVAAHLPGECFHGPGILHRVQQHYLQANDCFSFDQYHCIAHSLSQPWVMQALATSPNAPQMMLTRQSLNRNKRGVVSSMTSICSDK